MAANMKLRAKAQRWQERRKIAMKDDVSDQSAKIHGQGDETILKDLVKAEKFQISPALLVIVYLMKTRWTTPPTWPVDRPRFLSALGPAHRPQNA